MDQSSEPEQHPENQEQHARSRSPVAARDDRPSLGWPRTQRKTLLVFVLVGFLVPGLLILAIQHFAGAGTSAFTLKNELAMKGVTAIFIALATWIVSWQEIRPLADYGVPPKQAFGMRFWEGSLWGFAMLSSLLLCLRALGHFRLVSVALTRSAIYYYAFGWALVFVFVAISEELGFRGYWLFALTKRMGFWRATIFISVLFAVAHVPNHGETVLGILQVFGTGMLFCLMIRRTGTLWFALGFHAAWDWSQTFFYGVPDSGLLGEGHYLSTSSIGPGWLTGGSAGPEGSVFALAVLVWCALLIHLRFPKVLYPVRPL